MMVDSRTPGSNSSRARTVRFPPRPTCRPRSVTRRPSHSMVSRKARRFPSSILIGATLGSTVLVYGPCGPQNGLVSFSIDGAATSVNTSSPVAADNCLLFLSQGYSALNLHQLEITNQEGRPLSFNHLQFLRVLEHTTGSSSTTPGAIVGGVIGGIVFVALCIVLYSLRSRKTRQKINKSFALLCS